jgi:uncharacterized protein YprB with RNaseH-like and TPR domain
MSTIGDRIRGIVKAPAPAPDAAAPPAVPKNGPTVSSAPTLDRTLGGDWRNGCFVVERRREPHAKHGREPIAALAERLDRSAPEAPLFAGAAARPPFLFFDLETTGLSGGAGTQAFLVGCGWFADDGAFVTRQFLLTRPSDERAMLETVRAELARAGALVSFNGKSFDAPLLETRYAFHRVEWARDRLPHLDVLHPARRFWTGDDCSLGALEARLLGLRRAGDVAGVEVPSRYFQFLRTGNSQPLVAVLEHNRQDLLTLAALTARLLHLSRVGVSDARDAGEALALGRIYARAGLEDRGRDAFARAIALCRAPAGAFDPVRIESLRGLALAWRRVRCYEAAASCWRQLIEVRGCPPNIVREATEALAVHFEHRDPDLAAAKQFALRGLTPKSTPRAQQASLHRLARLERKITAQIRASSLPDFG